MLSEADHPLVQAFHSSTNQDTDHFAFGILENAGYKLSQVEDDAMWITQHVWKPFIKHISPQFYTHFDEIMRTLGQPKSPSNSTMLLAIKKAKDAYTDLIRSHCDHSCSLSVPCALGLDHICCCLFFCCVSVCGLNIPNTLWCQPGTVVQNSLWYCKQHFGLSLINARRHQCQLCFLFSVLVVRNTPSDQIHLDMIEKNLHIPLVGSGGPSTRYTLQRFCANDLMTRIHNGHTIDSHYDHIGSTRDKRPENSVVYTDRTDNRAIVAWVHMLQLMDDGQWIFVGMGQYQKMNRIFLGRKTLFPMRQQGFLTDRMN